MALLTDSLALIRVINLPERKDRYAEVTRQMKDLGLTWKQGSVELYSAKRPTDLAGFPSLGAHGCFMSHLEILRDALHRNVESVLVIEDDCEIPPKSCALIGDLATKMTDDDWHFLYFGHVAPLPAPIAAPAPGAQFQVVAYDGALQTTHMYAVRRSALAPLVEYLEGCLVRPPGDPIGGPMHVDGALSMFRAAHPELVTRILHPSIAGQRSSRSDITSGKFDTVPGVKHAISVARRLKRALLQ